MSQQVLHKHTHTHTHTNTHTHTHTQVECVTKQNKILKQQLSSYQTSLASLTESLTHHTHKAHEASDMWRQCDTRVADLEIQNTALTRQLNTTASDTLVNR
eukprot:GHVR01166117.1.p1 GENE.GHVR01166117.1~~GHVR01166117.1.p1  ORF type:complete len:101 (+),score=61.36 GHVR01166117.1:72-374(+)